MFFNKDSRGRKNTLVSDLYSLLARMKDENFMHWIKNFTANYNTTVFLTKIQLLTFFSVVNILHISNLIQVWMLLNSSELLWQLIKVVSLCVQVYEEKLCNEDKRAKKFPCIHLQIIDFGCRSCPSLKFSLHHLSVSVCVQSRCEQSLNLMRWVCTMWSGP